MSLVGSCGPPLPLPTRQWPNSYPSTSQLVLGVMYDLACITDRRFMRSYEPSEASLGQGSPVGKKCQKRLASLVDFFSFFFQCGAWSQAKRGERGILRKTRGGEK